MSYEKRADIPQQYLWDTTPLFATVTDWENGTIEAQKALPQLVAFKGTLNNKNTILKLFELRSKLFAQIERLYVYAFMQHDIDGKDTTAQMQFGKIFGILSKFEESISFMVPELSKLSGETLQEMIDDPDFVNFSVALTEILKGKAHVLSADEEKLIASLSPIFNGFKDAFERLDNGDLKFGTIKIDGEKMQLTHGSYGMLLEHPDQKVRQEAFKKYYKPYINYINTIASLYSSSVKTDWFTARARKFKSSLESALFYEDVDKKVYTNLINSVHNSLAPLHEYIALKKEVLGVETLNMYDLYVPIIKDADIKLDFDQAFELIKEGLKPLGEDYQELLDRAKNERWMDVYETPGKRSGAYSIGTYGAHPYVLLNYQQTTNDISTIAHELGHAMHSYYSSANQCYDKSGYTIFVAEVASTCNEILLLKHMLKDSKSKEVRTYLLTHYLDMLRTTLYRQAMFAEFEYIAHKKEEKDETLTYESLCKEYLKLNKKYYGKAVKHNKEISYEWARIPHFYRGFYVYKYSTGITSAVCIAEKILNEGPEAVTNYKKFLSLGGSLDPVSELKVAGVDLTTTEPFDIVTKSFSDTLAELKELLKK
ncbi:MAG: oligoendopeptidase F [Clostridia bacterium]